MAILNGWKTTLTGCCGLLILLGASACNQRPAVMESVTDPVEEGDDIAAVGLTAGKADGPFSDCDLAQIVSFVNDPSTSEATLRHAGVHTRASKMIPAYRNGLDNVPGTADDDAFDSAEELDDVIYVGPAAFRQLAAIVAPRCENIPVAKAQVVFSPKNYQDSHLALTAELILQAQRSIDVAMYSLRDWTIVDTLEFAVDRGVRVRLLFDTARKDKLDPEGTMSAALEDRGIDVRWVNKIMHHKFCIIDGPQQYANHPGLSIVMTGSGNWSHSAGTRYDENTVIFYGHYEAAYAFQMEFDHLWGHARLFDWNDMIADIPTTPITNGMLPKQQDFEALFTSANFRTYESALHGPTFGTLADKNTVSDRFVALIEGAQESIILASGHLRSRPISEALMAKQLAEPNVDIRVYLDGQEYISDYWYEKQQENLALCLEAAGDSQSKRRACVEKGFLFGYSLHQAGIDVRYKYYAYRWHYSYAEQMHHKYMVVDGQTLVTGSYNLSDNAEHQSFENVVIIQTDEFPQLVAHFESNFDTIWDTGRTAGLYDELMDAIVEATHSFPIVFPSMALNWDEVTALKEEIRDRCPDINSESYLKEPESHQDCSF
jgi:phosphatidylserine/phosphatidylglycerophosphate/cardiolipin synthase-like enzyme